LEITENNKVLLYCTAVAYPEGVLQNPLFQCAIFKIGYYSILIIQKPVLVNYKNGVIKTMHYQLKLEICENTANHISLKREKLFFLSSSPL